MSEKEIDDYVDYVLKSMSLEEKVKQMVGNGINVKVLFDLGFGKRVYDAAGSEKYNIPPLKFTDGPRGVIIPGSTCFPVSMARGASWDVDLEERVGDVIGKEVRTHGGNLFGTHLETGGLHCTKTIQPTIRVRQNRMRIKRSIMRVHRDKERFIGVRSVAYTVGLLLLGGLGCSKDEQLVTESIADIQRREGVPVRVISVQPTMLQVIEKAGGTVEGYYQTVVGSGTAASIVSIGVHVGDTVKKDDVLVRLDPTAASSQYRQAKAAYEAAEKAYARAKALVKEGGVPEELLDQAETGYTIAKANFDAATKSVRLLAPFSGTIVEVFEPLNKNVAIGDPLIKMAMLDTIRVRVNVNETLIHRYRTGQPAFIEVEGGRVTGKVVKVPLAGSPESHSFYVETVFANPKQLLKPGMFVTVHVVVDERTDALTLPIETILSEGKEKYVFVVKEGQAHKASLNIGVRGGDAFEILEGLEVGDLVVASGASRLSEGVKVKIVRKQAPNVSLNF